MAGRGNPNWKKGGPSPNPGGRPKIPPELRDAARAEALGSIQTLVALRDGARTPPYLRKAAADSLLRWAGGVLVAPEASNGHESAAAAA
jgi:hypothetical protein